MNLFFLWAAFLIAILDWIAVARDWRKVEYFAKPAVILTLLVWLGQNGGFSGHMAWFAIALLFSLLGDIFLVLPHEHFIPGLISFLLAHLAYIIGLNPISPPLNMASLVLAFVVLLTASQVYRRIAAGLQAKDDTRLLIPVLIYVTVLSLMVLSALLTLVHKKWVVPSALLISAGALLFMLSDTLLAWNKFVSSQRYGKVSGIVSYHLGQLLIIWGAAIAFIPPI